MDSHIGEILTTSLRNQVSEMDANISFTHKEIKDYLGYSTTIGFMTDRHKIWTCANIIAPSTFYDSDDLGPTLIESVAFNENDDVYEIFPLDNEKVDTLKNYHFLDVLTFHRLLLKKLKTLNRDLVKMVTLKHFKTACEYYKGRAEDLLLFLYLRMNVRVLNIPFKFPIMRLLSSDADDESSSVDDVDEYMRGRYLNFTQNNRELYQQILESINNF